MPKKSMTEKFICSNCTQEKETTELASTVPVYGAGPIKTCRDCYNLYHNPPEEKLKKESFYCNYCKSEVLSVKWCQRVSVSEPNELGLENGKTYNFCSKCRKKVVEYNEGEEDSEANPWDN